MDTMAHAVEQKVEWAYAFDVHCNSFFPVFLITYVLQFFFMPVLKHDNWISLFFGNTLYFCAAVWYIYGTFLGFNGKIGRIPYFSIITHVFLLALPFLAHTELFLYPILIGTILYIASLFGFNVSQNILTLYFGTN